VAWTHYWGQKGSARLRDGQTIATTAVFVDDDADCVAVVSARSLSFLTSPCETLALKLHTIARDAFSPDPQCLSVLVPIYPPVE
jgi:hypothetical protein